MKVRAIEGCHPNLTTGKIYDVVSISEGGEFWRVVNDNGRTDGYIPDVHFEVVEDEPKIEVGSLWIHDNGLEYEVTAVGEKVALAKHNNVEYQVRISNFGKSYKPKPKTVTMYFYKLPHGYVGYSNEHPFDTITFTREIELP